MLTIARRLPTVLAISNTAFAIVNYTCFAVTGNWANFAVGIGCSIALLLTVKLRAFYFLQEAVLDCCEEAAKTIEEILIENS